MNCKVCGTTSKKNPSVSYFRFPKEKSRCKDWAERCNLQHLLHKHGTLQFYKSFRICSNHFQSKDIFCDGKKKRLLQHAVPQIFTEEETTKCTLKENNQNETEVNSLRNFCRLCAGENRNLIHILSWRGKTLELENKLKYIPLMVNKNDGLPLSLCDECISKVNQFYNFITKCFEAEAKLKNLLELEKNVTCKVNEISDKLQERVQSISKLDDDNTTSVIKHGASSTIKCDIPSVIKHHVSSVIKQHIPSVIKHHTSTDLINKVKINENNENGVSTPQSNFSQSKLKNLTKSIQRVGVIRSTCNNYDYSNSSSNIIIETDISDQRFCNEPKYSCDICLETFTRLESLNQHAVTHFLETDEKDQLISQNSVKRGCSNKNDSTQRGKNVIHKCQICGKGFHLVMFLKRHMEESHHRCSQSLQKTSTNPNKPSLKSHTGGEADLQQKQSLNCKTRLIKKFNTFKEPKRKCRFCDQIFTTRQFCEDHEKFHTGETPYLCRECGKNFRSRPTLRQHRSVHSDKRLYACADCGKSFKRKDTLIIHSRIHTEERPYVCKICGFAFKQRGDCKKHEKNHDKGN